MPLVLPEACSCMPSDFEELVTSRLAELRQQIVTDYNAELFREVEEHSRQLTLEVVILRAENDQLREQLALPARPPCTVERKASTDKLHLSSPDVAASKPTPVPPPEFRHPAVVPLPPPIEPPGLVADTKAAMSKEIDPIREDRDDCDSVRSAYSLTMSQAGSLRSVNQQDADDLRSECSQVKVAKVSSFRSVQEQPHHQVSSSRRKSEMPQPRVRASFFGRMGNHERNVAPALGKLESLDESLTSPLPSSGSCRRADRAQSGGQRYQTLGQARPGHPLSRQSTTELSDAGSYSSNISWSRVHPAAKANHRRHLAHLSNSEESLSPKSGGSTAKKMLDEEARQKEDHKQRDREEEDHRLGFPDEARRESHCTVISNPISEDDFYFLVWPIWGEKDRMKWANSCKGSRMFRPTASQDKDSADDDSESGDEEDRDVVKSKTVRKGSCVDYLQRVTLLPSSPVRVMWDLIGVLMIGYDFVVVPLQFFDPPTTLFLAIMGWIVRFYWTLDFPLSFITGYTRPEGRVEMRNLQILLRYISTWMFFDMIILSFDWMEVVVGESGASSFAFFRWRLSSSPSPST